MKGLQGERTEQSRVVPPGNENAKERKNNAQLKREWKMSGVRVTKGKKREKGADGIWPRGEGKVRTLTVFI